MNSIITLLKNLDFLWSWNLSMLYNSIAIIHFMCKCATVYILMRYEFYV